jgi:hypothetical protein
VLIGCHVRGALPGAPKTLERIRSGLPLPAELLGWSAASFTSRARPGRPSARIVTRMVSALEKVRSWMAPWVPDSGWMLASPETALGSGNCPRARSRAGATASILPPFWRRRDTG